MSKEYTPRLSRDMKHALFLNSAICYNWLYGEIARDSKLYLSQPISTHMWEKKLQSTEFTCVLCVRRRVVGKAHALPLQSTERTTARSGASQEVPHWTTPKGL